MGRVLLRTKRTRLGKGSGKEEVEDSYAVVVVGRFSLLVLLAVVIVLLPLLLLVARVLEKCPLDRSARVPKTTTKASKLQTRPRDEELHHAYRTLHVEENENDDALALFLSSIRILFWCGVCTCVRQGTTDNTLLHNTQPRIFAELRASTRISDAGSRS
jgi:hypothetical protein